MAGYNKEASQKCWDLNKCLNQELHVAANRFSDRGEVCSYINAL